MKGLSLFLLTLTGLLPVCLAATHYECSNPRSRWDYWWWPASESVYCAPWTSCATTFGGKITIPWDLTQGPPIDYRVAESAAKQFAGDYTYAKNVKWENTVSYPVAPGSTVRLWFKQWYVVSDVDCVACTDIGTCSKPSQVATTWVPCLDGSCGEWQVSDADGRCDSGNHCTIP